MPSGDAHRSLARALDILELCSLNGSGYTLTQLSQHLGIAKGSISPLLHTLRDRGYLTLDDQDHHYRIGRMAFRIGNTYLDEASALREIYRLHEAEFRPGYDLVVVARGRAVNASYAKLERSMLSLASQLGVRSEKGDHPETSAD